MAPPHGALRTGMFTCNERTTLHLLPATTSIVVAMPPGFHWSAALIGSVPSAHHSQLGGSPWPSAFGLFRVTWLPLHSPGLGCTGAPPPPFLLILVYDNFIERCARVSVDRRLLARCVVVGFALRMVAGAQPVAPPLPPVVLIDVVRPWGYVGRPHPPLVPHIPLCAAGQPEGVRHGQSLAKGQELVHVSRTANVNVIITENTKPAPRVPPPCTNPSRLRTIGCAAARPAPSAKSCAQCSRA